MAEERHDRAVPRDDGGEVRSLSARILLALTSLGTRRGEAALRYGSAPVATLVAALAQHALMPDPRVAPFVFFYLGVALVASAFGRGPGLAAVALSALVANHAVVSPFMEWSTSAPALSATAFFALTATPVALLCASLRTALLRAERIAGELRRMGDLLREEDARKNEFLGVLSHELRNPLAPIRNSVYILARAPPGGEQATRSLAVIERQVLQLARLTDDLLDVTRIARGKVRLQRERVELGELARRTAEDHRQLFANDGIRLEVSVGDAPVHVHADPVRIRQVIGNLLRNAAKFTPPGGRATLSLRTEGGVAVITVADTGVGIAPDVLRRLFEPFVQAESTLERSQGGLGLGLALVKGLVELHGGKVSARSEGSGKGATFVVELELDLERRATPGAGPARPSVAARRVLLIEDNVDAALSLKEALELDHHVIEVAYNGAEGLERARALRPDVILCDIGLPVMSGFQVARAVRADPALRSVALIALSGYAQAEDVEEARRAGFDLHLAKPVDPDVLQRTMGEVLHRAAAQVRSPGR